MDAQKRTRSERCAFFNEALAFFMSAAPHARQPRRARSLIYAQLRFPLNDDNDKRMPLLPDILLLAGFISWTGTTEKIFYFLRRKAAFKRQRLIIWH